MTILEFRVLKYFHTEGGKDKSLYNTIYVYSSYTSSTEIISKQHKDK